MIKLESVRGAVNDWGRLPEVQLKPGATATEDELRAWVASRLAAFKVPVRVVLWRDMLPRNAAGKILKNDLKGAFNTLTHL